MLKQVSINPLYLYATLTSLFISSSHTGTFKLFINAVIHKREKSGLTQQNIISKQKNINLWDILISFCLRELKSFTLSKALGVNILLSESHEKPFHVETKIVSSASSHVDILMYIVKATEKQWSHSFLTSQPILKLLKSSHFSNLNTSASKILRRKVILKQFLIMQTQRYE